MRASGLPQNSLFAADAALMFATRAFWSFLLLYALISVFIVSTS